MAIFNPNSNSNHVKLVSNTVVITDAFTDMLKIVDPDGNFFTEVNLGALPTFTVSVRHHANDAISDALLQRSHDGTNWETVESAAWDGQASGTRSFTITNNNFALWRLQGKTAANPQTATIQTTITASTLPA